MYLTTRPRSTFRTAFIALTALAALTAGAVLAQAPPTGATEATVACHHGHWGSLAKWDETMSYGPVVDARAGRHACFDRFVVDLSAAPAPGYNVRYVSAVTEPGSGEVVPLRGGARLQVTAHAPAYDLDGLPTYEPADWREAVPVAGFSTFRQIAYVGSYEGYTDFGLGVRARLPFRVFTLPDAGGHTRLVIDVAHSWN